VRFLTPLKGFSEHDSVRGHLHEPSIPPVFAQYLGGIMPPHIPVEVIDCHFNDPAFADAIVAQALALTGAKASA
jgi:uncharacterized protein (UPF0261 family)